MATMVSGLGGPAGYGEGVFTSTPLAAGNLDDGAVQVDISSVFGSGLDFFGTSYSSLYINSNGTISFGAANTAYAPALNSTTTPTIAAFWSDVNLNNGGNIYWDLDPANGQVTITWDGVAPYSGGGNNSFQLVLTDLGNGDFNVDYIYGDITWTNGGSGTAQTGLTDGGANDIALPGSGNSATLAQYETYDFGTADPTGTTDMTFVNGGLVTPDGVVDGTSGADTIGAGYVDSSGDQIDGTDGDSDVVKAGDGNDTVASGAGNDTVYGGQGADTIDGGTGNDTIYGDDGPVAPANEDFNWSLEGGDATNLGAGVTQNTGTMDVSVTMTSTGNNNPRLTVETTETEYVAGGESFDSQSAGLLYGQGDGATADLSIDFASVAGSGMSDAVSNVAFRINDVDRMSGNHWDQFTVTAYDANGNPVPVTITPAGNDTVSGGTVTAGNTNDTQDQAQSSVLIEVAGPVSQIVVSYENLDVNTQGIYFTDIQFTTIPDTASGGDDVIDGGLGDDIIYGEAGNDIITGGGGADTLYGGTGDDTLYVGDGDLADGGDGDDLFILDPTNALGGAGSTLSIDGSETGESAGDTIDFSGLIDWGTINWTGAESGTATLSDGTLVSFANIENVIICFTRGTAIATPHGERPVESLRPGDLVLTRDHGPQPLRWIGARRVLGAGSFAPVRFARGAFGNDRELWVSPQHRMLYAGGMATLYFDSPEVMVPAKHLIDGRAIAQVEVERVTYYHLLFDRHEVIWGNGAPSESFHPGDEGLGAVDPAAREELFALFPDLRADPSHYGRTARTVLKSYEARLLQPEPASAAEPRANC